MILIKIINMVAGLIGAAGVVYIAICQHVLVSYII